MNLPREYSYNPRWHLIAFLFGAGSVWIALLSLFCRCMPNGFILWFGALPIITGILLAVRRLSCNRYLRLDSDGLILPTGFLRLRPARIPYTSIERVWQTSIPWMAVLCIATKEGKFEVLSGMLPDTGSYLAVREFLNWQAKNNLNN